MILGYCCLNLTLREQKPSIFTGRKLIRRTFDIHKASQLALQNVKDALYILQWNEEYKIRNFRLTSEFFPRITDPCCAYKTEDLDDAEEIEWTLGEIGKYALKHNHVLSMHPGPYTCLASDNEEVIRKSIQDIEIHNWVAEKLCLHAPKLTVNINWHVGRNYAEGIAKRFLDNWSKLSEGAKNRTTIENDDSKNGWSITKLVKELHESSGIRITHDLHHSIFSSEGVSLEEEFRLAKSTWNADDWQEVHYSESANKEKIIPDHSDYFERPLPDFILQEPKVYVELECKAKELALLKYRLEFPESSD